MSQGRKTRRLGKRFMTILLTLAMIVSLTPSLGALTGGALGAQEAYAATDTITRVDITTNESLPSMILTGDPVEQPAFTVTNVVSSSGEIEPSDIVFETGEYYGWCQSYDNEGDTDWFKYAEDGIQDLFFTSGESRMMVDIFADPDKVSAIFTSDSEVYLNGQLMSFYKLYANDEDYVGYISYTATDPISGIDFTIDTDAINLNTAYTEDEMNSIVRPAIKYDSTIFYLRSWKGLYYKVVDDVYGIWWQSCGDSDEYLDPSKEYYAGFQALSIFEKANKYWPYAARICNEDTLAGDVTGFDVTVNGEKRYDAWMACYGSTQKEIAGYFYIPLGTVSTEPIITKVAISGNDIAIKAGTAHAFTVEVKGTLEDHSVIWSVDNAQSSNTTVSSEGVLTVGEDEAAETIIVKATSVADPTKSDQKTVTVLQEDPVIESVTVTPEEADVYVGNNQQFKAAVTGTETDKSVNWTIIGANSSATVISNTGRLTVASDETAETITVYATSVVDPSKSDSAIVNVKHKEIISEIRFSLDIDDALDLTKTEKEVNDNIRPYFKYDSSIFYLRSWKGLYYKVIDDYGIWWQYCGDSDEYLDPAKEYYAGIQALSIQESVKKDWPDTVKASDEYALAGDIAGFDVYVNDKKRDDAWMGCFESGSYAAYFYIPLKFNISQATITGIKDKTYTGKALTQTPTVTMGGKTLKKDTDYTLSYKNNTNVGTATVTIKGKGNFEGTISKTFTIKRKAITPKITLSKSYYFYSSSYDRKPTVTVYDGDTKLESETYIVKWPSDVRSAGKKTVTVTMKGNYSGKNTATYTIFKPTVKLSKTAFAYTGSSQKPTVSVYNGDTKIGSANYTVTWPSNTTSVGKKSVKITMKGKYYGTKTVTYKINPSATTLSSVTAGTKQLTVKWTKKSTAQCTGYEVQYWKSGDSANAKTITVTGNTTVSKTIKSLQSGKTYYVRVRVYKTVDGVKYRSAWSEKKSVKVK